MVRPDNVMLLMKMATWCALDGKVVARAVGFTVGFMAGEGVASFVSAGWVVMALGAADFGSVKIVAGGGDLEVEGDEEEQPPVPQMPPTMAMTSSNTAIIPNKT
jgi:hypothetical protein